jgi:hypothetical protein
VAVAIDERESRRVSGSAEGIDSARAAAQAFREGLERVAALDPTQYWAAVEQVDDMLAWLEELGGLLRIDNAYTSGSELTESERRDFHGFGVRG